MTLSSVFSLFVLLIGCTLGDDPYPNDAPDLDFSKAQWVNEFKYDGVFTTTKDKQDICRSFFQIYGAETKKFEPSNSNYKLENGFWIDPTKSKFMGYPLPYQLSSGIRGIVKVNDKITDARTENEAFLNGFNYNDITKYNKEKGIKWEVIKLTFPDFEPMKSQNNLSEKDEASFKFVKEGLIVFPEPIQIEDKYKLGTEDNELIIRFEPRKDADLIYVKFSHEGYDLGNDLGPFKSRGFIKYYKGDETTIKINKNDIVNLMYNKKIVTMTVSAIKFYTDKNDGRNFLFKNSSDSQALIFID